jgi:hypothetical protein
MNSTWRQISPVPDITESKIFYWQLLFKWDTTHETARKTAGCYWTSLHHLTAKQWHVTGSYTFFDSSSVNHNVTDYNDPKYYRLWKLWHICDTLKILCPFQTPDCGFRLNFKQYIPKQCIHFGINSYKLCSISKCMNSRVGVTANRTASHANIRHGHKQHNDKFFHCLTYWTICQRGKSTAGRQYDLTERKWHRTYCLKNYWLKIFCLG